MEEGQSWLFGVGSGGVMGTPVHEWALQSTSLAISQPVRCVDGGSVRRKCLCWILSSRTDDGQLGKTRTPSSARASMCRQMSRLGAIGRDGGSDPVMVGPVSWSTVSTLL